MNPTVTTYIGYLVIAIPLTIWVAKTLHKNGRIFLVKSMDGDEPLADSINHLLVVGFYLVNLGCKRWHCMRIEDVVFTFFIILSIKIVISGIIKEIGRIPWCIFGDVNEFIGSQFGLSWFPPLEGHHAILEGQWDFNVICWLQNLSTSMSFPDNIKIVYSLPELKIGKE